MSVAEFSPVYSKTGVIKKTGLTYDVYANVSPAVGFDVPPATVVEQRAYFNFDTSSLPDAATITQVRFYWDLTFNYQSSTNPADWVNLLYLGTFIGAALDSSDWNGGTYVLVKDWTANPIDGVWLTLLSASHSLVSKTGETDLRIIDVSNYSAGNGNWLCIMDRSRCKLEVTYTVPTRRVMAIS